jgi:hypothetical protein
VIETEDYAAARISWFAERSGVKSEGLELAIFRFRDGKIAEVSFFQDAYDLDKLREVFPRNGTAAGAVTRSRLSANRRRRVAGAVTSGRFV